MASVSEHEEIPLPLVQVRARRFDDADEGSQEEDGSATVEPEANDRMGPPAAGGLAGIFAGCAALGIVHAAAPVALAEPVRGAAAQWGVATAVSFAVAYVTAAAIGGLVGAAFASVTRYLRRYFPLLVWALVFFVSLTLLLLALGRTYGPDLGEALAPVILGASAAYAFLVSLSLPMRKRA